MLLEPGVRVLGWAPFDPFGSSSPHGAGLQPNSRCCRALLESRAEGCPIGIVSEGRQTIRTRTSRSTFIKRSTQPMLSRSGHIQKMGETPEIGALPNGSQWRAAPAELTPGHTTTLARGWQLTCHTSTASLVFTNNRPGMMDSAGLCLGEKRRRAYRPGLAGGRLAVHAVTLWISENYQGQPRGSGMGCGRHYEYQGASGSLRRPPPARHISC